MGKFWYDYILWIIDMIVIVPWNGKCTRHAPVYISSINDDNDNDVIILLQYIIYQRCVQHCSDGRK